MSVNLGVKLPEPCREACNDSNGITIQGNGRCNQCTYAAVRSNADSIKKSFWESIQYIKEKPRQGFIVIQKKEQHIV